MWLMNPDGSERSVAVPQAHNVLSISSCGDRYLLFDSYRDGKVELWRADADGLNGIKQLDEVRYSDCSADGKWMFYVVNDKLYRMPPGDGPAVEIMTVPGHSGAWRVKVSPDGTAVAFMYQEGSPVPVSKLGVVSAAGGPLRFTSTVPIGSVGLCWSPTGKALQYLLTRNGATNVWEQALTGGAPRQITNFPSGRIFDFAWSRGGKQLLLAKGNQSSDVILISNFR